MMFMEQSKVPAREYLGQMCGLNQNYERTFIGLAPDDDPIVMSVGAAIESELANSGMKVKYFKTEDEILKYVDDDDYELDAVNFPGLCFAVTLDGSGADGYEIAYHFEDQGERLRNSNLPSQQNNVVDDFIRVPNFGAFAEYAYGGFLYIQNMFANQILRAEKGGTSYISNLVVPMKTNDYTSDDFMANMSGLWNFFLVLIFMAPLYRLIHNVVNEKEQKVRELMRMMGLTDFPYWMSWLLYYTIILTFIAFIMTLLLIPIFTSSNKLLIFLTIWVYGMSLFSFGVFISAFFSSGKAASIVGCFMYYFTSWLILFCESANGSQLSKHIFSIIPTIPMQLTGPIIFDYETQGVGIGFDNWTDLHQNYRFIYSLMWNAISFFFFLILGVYLEKVLPQTYGVRLQPWFIFQPSFWCGSCMKGKNRDDQNDSESSAKNYKEEPVQENLLRLKDDGNVLEIKNLRKRFGDFNAVDNLNVEMYSGQIFALLGHNGAGKTTTINCLTGMMSKSSGGANIFGLDVFEQVQGLRRIMGVCPQHNILYPLLTVYEHLQMYATFKGQSRKETKKEIDTLLKELHLENKRNTQSR